MVDTNGNGKRDAYTEPGEPHRSEEGQAYQGRLLWRRADPADGSIWGSSLGFPGGIVRLVPGPIRRQPR